MNKNMDEITLEQSKKPIYTCPDIDSILLKDLDCIVCMESAIDMLGYSNGENRRYIKVYSEKDFHIPYIKCNIVENLSDVPYVEKEGIKVSPIEFAMNDMLEKEPFSISLFDNKELRKIKAKLLDKLEESNSREKIKMNSQTLERISQCILHRRLK